MVASREQAVSGGVAARQYTANPADLPPGTLVDLFFSAIEHGVPNAQMRRTEGGWQPISHAEVLANVRDIAASLRAWGFARGDRVGLLSENRPEWAWADYALLCTGVLTVPLYPTLPPQQIAFILRHAGVRTIFVSNAAQLEKILDIRGELPALERIIVFDAAAARGQDVLSLQDVMHAGRTTYAQLNVGADAVSATHGDVHLALESRGLS
jgi:long-chain acyl-CoA synthetase